MLTKLNEFKHKLVDKQSKLKKKNTSVQAKLIWEHNGIIYIGCREIKSFSISYISHIPTSHKRRTLTMAALINVPDCLSPLEDAQALRKACHGNIIHY